jgi:hypothetical protein
MEDKQGLLGFIASPEGQGLLATVFGGLAGARRGQPLNSLGRAGMAGMMGYGNALERNVKLGEAEQMKQYRAAQMENYQSEAAQRNALLDAAKRKQEAVPRLFSGGSPALSPLMGDEASGILPSAGRPAIAPIFDINKAVSSGLFTAKEIEDWAKVPDAGKQEVARTIETMDGQGRPITQQFDKFGRVVGGGGLPQWKAPISVNQGDRTTFADPVTLAPKGSFGMNQTPDSKASNFVSMRGQNMTDSRARDRLAFETTGGGEGGVIQAGLNRQFGKPQAGYRWKADGSLEFIPGGPADQKAQLKTSGEGTVDSVVADIRDKYTQLKTGGGITDTQNGGLSNLVSGIQSSGVGQAAGRLFGTQNQSQRNNIAMSRPLLLQAIMKATGMSAKQMDSNAELKLYLATATDPTLDVQSNMEALDRIEKLYGSGQKSGTDSNAPAAAKPMPTNPTAQNLTKGQTYTLPNGAEAVWDGMKFKGK